MKTTFEKENMAHKMSLKDVISKSCRMSQSNGLPSEMLFEGEISWERQEMHSSAPWCIERFQVMDTAYATGG